MVKRTAFVLLAALCVLVSNAQTAGRYRFHKKDYLVYPLRVDNDELPQPGISIPDGEYVVFHNYIFKHKRFGNKTVLKDTAKVVAFVHVKNSSLNGPATIYEYSQKGTGIRKSPGHLSEGNYKDGQKDSTWTYKNLYTGWHSTTEYKNDMANGFRYTYDKKGRILGKIKYKNDERIDTVFHYGINGLVDLAYDVYPDSEKTENNNHYAEALKYFPDVLTHNSPKTFYRAYDRSGKLLKDLKFEKGAPLPFDSVRFGSATVKVVSDPAKDHYKIIYQADLGNEIKHVEEDYTGFVQTGYTRTDYFKKSRATNITETQRFQLDTTIDPSVPQLVMKQEQPWGKQQTYYIPRYRFVYQKINRQGITSIDPSGPAIYMSDTTESANQVLAIKETFSIPADSAVFRNLRHVPYLDKTFIVNEEIPSPGDNNELYYAGTEELQEDAKEYIEHALSTRYVKDGKGFNGRVFFVPVTHKLHANDSLTEINANFFNEFSKGRLLNGKQQGAWLTASSGLDVTVKHTPKNLYSYYLSSSSGGARFDTTSYRDGLKNGRTVCFSAEARDDMEDFVPYTYTAKERDELWKKNLSKSKKMFMYKCLEMNYVNDTLSGPYKSYHSNTALNVEMTFVKGRPQGDYRRYNQQGNLMASGHFENGKFEGPFYAYQDPIYEAAMKNTLRMKALFKNNHLNDTLFYYYDGLNPYMAFKLRNDTLVFKRQYFAGGRLQEDITFSPQSAYAITEQMLESSNYFDIINASGDESLRKAEADYRSYYDNGQVLAEGKIAAGYPAGDWKFYNVNGTLVHQIDFVDTTVLLPGAEKATEISGFYTGYYSNGKIRCRGYLDGITLSYDCFVKQDKPNLDFYVMDFYDMYGKQMVSGGSGYLVKYDENGLRMASGQLKNCKEDSIWRYYTPEQKLTSIGNYVNQKKDGIWYDGDLEGINFEDGACFDQGNKYEMEEYQRKRKEIRITKTIFINGVSEKRTSFSSDLNKTQGTYYEGDF